MTSGDAPLPVVFVEDGVDPVESAIGPTIAGTARIEPLPNGSGA
jgi:hypothetical protein